MITLYRYALPLVRPVATRRGALATRMGVLVRASDAQGRVAWGDAAPWPGLSRESVDAAEAELKIWRQFREDGRAFSPRCSSVAFAMETIAADFSDEVGTARRAVRQKQENQFSTAKIPINALLSDEPLEPALHALSAAGFRTLKIKVGRQSVRADAERILEVRRLVGPDMKLRLDANRAWTLADALEFGRRIAAVQIEYIEEPLQNPAELPAFHEHSGLAVALDESLLEQPLEKFRACRGACAVIIKPTILGGLGAAARLAAAAAEQGLTPVFSAVYESGVGIRALAHLAARWGAPEVAMGLDTYRCLAADVLQPRLAIRDGALDLEEADCAEVCIGNLQAVP